MVDAGSLYVDVLPNVSKFAPALTAQMRTAQVGVTRATSGITSSLGGVSSAFSKFGISGPLAMASAGAAVGALGKIAVDAFTESEAVLAQLNNTLERLPGFSSGASQAFQDQATALMELTGFSDEAILSADTLLTRFQLTEQQIQEAIPIILDYARATGRDVPEAAEAIGKALLGNTRALKEIGIDFTATGDRAEDFATIMGLVEDRVGGSAEAFGETAAGQMAIFGQKLDELAEMIGAALVPVLTTLIDLLEGIGGALGPIFHAFEELGHVLRAVAGDVEAQNDIWDDTVNFFRSLVGLNQDVQAAYIGTKESVKSAADQAEDYVAGLEAMAGVIELNTIPASKDLTAALEIQGQAQQRLIDSNDELRRQALLLAGGLEAVGAAADGLADSQADLRDAQAEVNRLADRGKQGTDAYREALEARNDAERDVLQSSGDLISTTQDFIEESGHSRDAVRTAKEELRAWGVEAGLSKDAINRLIREALDPLRDKIQNFPALKVTGIDTAKEQLASLQAYIDSLDAVVSVSTSFGPGTGRDRRQFHEGGWVGSPTGGSREVPIMALTDEFVVNPKASKRHRGLLEKINSFHNGGSVADLNVTFDYAALVGGLVEAATNAATQAASSPAPVSGSAQGWLSTALSLAGAPASWLGALSSLMMAESGGNPYAWNPNTVASGQHAAGLMQTIGTTFDAYNRPGIPDTGGTWSKPPPGHPIWNPIENATAAVNYIQARYGYVPTSPYHAGGVLPADVWGMDTRGRGVHMQAGETVVPRGGTPHVVHVYIDGQEVRAIVREEEHDESVYRGRG